MGTWGTGISSNDIYEDIFWYSSKFYDQELSQLEIVGNLKTSKVFNSDKDYVSLSPWENVLSRSEYCTKDEFKSRLSLKNYVLNGGFYKNQE